jgi:HEPN domain-containing protein
VNRNDLHDLAETRIREAEVLLSHDCPEGAYYLAGYAVECALKACIAKQIKKHDFPDRKLILDSYTHDLSKLLSLSGVKDKQRKRAAQNPDFELSWAVVKDWSEKEAYAPSIDGQRAQNLLVAITDPKAGILPWLKTWW